MCTERYFYHSQSNVSVKIHNTEPALGFRASEHQQYLSLLFDKISPLLSIIKQTKLFSSSVCIECLLLNRIIIQFRWRNFCSFNNRINGAYSFRRYIYRETSQWVVNECRERFEMDFLSKLMRSKQQTSPEARSSVN